MSRTQLRQERNHLFRLVVSRLIMGALLIGGLLFASAGTFLYWQAWLFLAALAISLSLTLVLLLKKDLVGLAKRKALEEPRRKEQRKSILVSGLVLVIGFFLPGLDYRFQWSDVPVWLIGISCVLFECAYGMIVAAFFQNCYASRVVEVQEGRQLIDTGLYSLVRHPMYLASIILFLSIPLMLGSYYAIIPMALGCLGIIARIKDEEEMLKEEMPGYTDYTQRVKYRLLPYIW